MKMTLAPELEALIREKVDTGLYKDAEDVVRRALELLDEVDRSDEPLRAEVQKGLDDYTAGRVTVIHNEAELRAFFGEL